MRYVRSYVLIMAIFVYMLISPTARPLSIHFLLLPITNGLHFILLGQKLSNTSKRSAKNMNLLTKFSLIPKLPHADGTRPKASGS